MSVKSRHSLGRNLSALLSHSTLLQDIKAHDDQFRRLPMAWLQASAYQPRREMKEATLKELAASIKKQGLLQPLVVRQIDNERFEILAGERRWRAAQLAGFSDIPVMIKDVDNESAMAIALVENLQREDLNALEEAEAMQRLINECDLTHQQVADLLGKSRAAVSNHLRLLSLTAHVKELLEQAKLDMGHARALLTLNPEEQIQIAKVIIEKQLSVRQTEQLIHNLTNKPNVAIKAQPHALDQPNPLFRKEAERLTRQLNAPVKIRQTASGKGTLIIHFDTTDALEKLFTKLGNV